ncbi:MAG: CdaR family protein [Caldiserica bacterium]|nr:CdaR family protein [Caldisericota bacterium]
MKKFFKGLLDIKVLSVIFAIALWYYVVGIQGPTIVRNYTKVPVVPINVPNESFVVNNLGYVAISAEGPSKVILGIKDIDFTALVDMAGKEAGDYYLVVETRSPLSNVAIKSVSPDKVKVQLETLSSLSLPISVVFQNVPQEFLPDNPIVSPSSATVLGPESALRNVDKVYVTVDFKSIGGEDTYTLPIQIAMKEGSTNEHVYINPASCAVVIRKLTSGVNLTLPITANIQGTPYSGFGLKSVTVSPNTILVKGSYDVLSKINSIQTLPIDISNLTKPTDFNINLVLPDGVSSDAQKSCTVKVDIQPVTSQTFKIPITVLHSQDKTISANVNSVEVSLTGFKDILSSLDISSVKAEVDVTNFASGTYDLPVHISNLPQGIFANIIIPSWVEVKIY